jgi:hypothetical protein
MDNCGLVDGGWTCQLRTCGCWMAEQRMELWTISTVQTTYDKPYAVQLQVPQPYEVYGVCYRSITAARHHPTLPTLKSSILPCPYLHSISRTDSFGGLLSRPRQAIWKQPLPLGDPLHQRNELTNSLRLQYEDRVRVLRREYLPTCQLQTTVALLRGTSPPASASATDDGSY